MATSTPNIGYNRTLHERSRKNSSSASSADCSSEDDEHDEIKHNISATTDSSISIRNSSTNDTSILPELSKMIYLSTPVLLVVLLLILTHLRTFSSEIQINSISFTDIKKKFPSQSEYIWNAFQSGIYEIEKFNKPSVLLLLHENDASKTVDLLLNTIGNYTSEILNKGFNAQPIVLSANKLNIVNGETDYGYVISKYKPELEKKSVMIVKNLDKLSGEIAQAFHSICDEFTPLVSRSMIIFTIEIQNLISDKTDYKMVEDILRRSWHNLNDDIFYPLFTRVSGLILRIKPENYL